MRGRTSRASTWSHGRQYATGVSGTIITFVCERLGHEYKINYGLKRLPVSRRMGPSGCKMMASWWSRAKGGCIGECPECEKAANVTKEP